MTDTADLVTHEVCPLCRSWGRVTWRVIGSRRRFARIECAGGCGDYPAENAFRLDEAFPPRPL